MKYALTSFVLTALAGPALAHAGAHVHPHADSPLWWPVAAGVLAIALAGVVMARRK
jgi:hypothetical protein